MTFSIERKFLLFDLDGTLIDSTSVIERLWTEWGVSHGIDPGEILKVSHGRRARDTMQMFLGKHADLDAMSAAFIESEISMTEGIIALPGAAEFLASLPDRSWGIVTSCVSRLANARLRAAKLPFPGIIVTADDVEAGKPSPEGFLSGAHRLGARPSDCLVFEDAATGVEAARAAGMATVLVHKSARDDDVVAVIPDYRGAHVATQGNGNLRLSFGQSGQAAGGQR